MKTPIQISFSDEEKLVEEMAERALKRSIAFGNFGGIYLRDNKISEFSCTRYEEIEAHFEKIKVGYLTPHVYIYESDAELVVGYNGVNISAHFNIVNNHLVRVSFDDLRNRFQEKPCSLEELKRSVAELFGEIVEKKEATASNEHKFH